jgi:hypothetical protein
MRMGINEKSPQPPFTKGGYQLDTANVINNPPTPRNFGGRWRSTETVLQQAVSHLSQTANVPLLRNSFGFSTRDRAARLRSSDVLKRGIPDAKAQDVVA